MSWILDLTRSLSPFQTLIREAQMWNGITPLKDTLSDGVAIVDFDGSGETKGSGGGGGNASRAL